MKKLILMLSVASVVGASSASAAHHKCTVQEGDNLYNISKRYNVDFSRVLELNKNHLRDVDLIHPKMHVYIPIDDGNGYNAQESLANNDNTNTNEINASNTQAQQILDIVNAERQKNNLDPLQLDATLNKVATVKAKDMGDNNYFSHNSPSYGSPFDLMHAFGVDYKSAGENIAAGQKSAQEVMNAWLNSSGHRANILNANYTHLGVGYYNSGQTAPYWVQEFIGK